MHPVPSHLDTLLFIERLVDGLAGAASQNLIGLRHTEGQSSRAKSQDKSPLPEAKCT